MLMILPLQFLYGKLTLTQDLINNKSLNNYLETKIMETFTLEPGQSGKFNVKGGFYLSQYFVNIKVLGQHKDSEFHFGVRFDSLGSEVVGFNVYTDAPYFHGAGVSEYADNLSIYQGPYRQIEIKSYEINEKTLTINVWLTQRI
jgi:hypothetical protein